MIIYLNQDLRKPIIPPDFAMLRYHLVLMGILQRSNSSKKVGKIDAENS